MWADETNNNFQDSKFFIWTLRKCKTVKRAYYIEQLYGEIKPRIMSNKDDPQLWSSLSCSRKKNQMYDECFWCLQPASQQTQFNEEQDKKTIMRKPE